MTYRTTDTPARVVIRRAYCETCGGELKWTGDTWSTDQTVYIHACACLGSRQPLPERFPREVFIEDPTPQVPT